MMPYLSFLIIPHVGGVPFFRGPNVHYFGIGRSYSYRVVSSFTTLCNPSWVHLCSFQLLNLINVGASYLFSSVHVPQ